MSPAHLERIEAPIRILAELVEAFNHRDEAGLARQIASDCSLEAPGLPPQAGREAILEGCRGVWSALPEARLRVEEVFGAGFRGVLRWRLEGGTSPGTEPPRGPIRGALIISLRQGLLGEIFLYSESLSRAR